MNPCPENRTERAWSFVEMLVAVSLSALFLGAATLVYSSIAVNSKRLVSLVEVEIGAAAMQNFYNIDGTSISVYAAPNHGAASRAQELRERMLDDAQRSFAVHCLPRAVFNTVRPEFLPFPDGSSSGTAPRPRLDTPEAFRQFLVQAVPGAAAVYDLPLRNLPPAERPSTTVFMLSNTADPASVRVEAVYEIDLLAVPSAGGTYASVRRYRNGALTHRFNVFYEQGPGSPFRPGFAAFERTARRAVAEGSATDRFKVAPGSPFYFLWLPDPSVNPYYVPPPANAAPADSPRAAYEHMASKTGFLVVLPMFPEL